MTRGLKGLRGRPLTVVVQRGRIGTGKTKSRVGAAPETIEARGAKMHQVAHLTQLKTGLGQTSRRERSVPISASSKSRATGARVQTRQR
mgnify:CR=1 FL=1